MTSRTELNLDNLAVQWLRDDIAQISLNMPGKSANIIDPNLQNDLEQAIDFLGESRGIKGAVLISGKEKIFVAGADLNSIVQTLDWPDDRIHEFCFRGQRLFNRLQELPFVTVAAIHGACVGGGLELALGCHFQIATADRRTVLGLPETKLGLIPGWAGTVRLPRLIGLEPAIDLITSSRLFDAHEAVSMGLIEQAVSPESLLSAAIALIDHPESWQRAATRTAQQHAPVADAPAEIEPINSQWQERLAASTTIFPFAAQVLATHMISSANQGFNLACESEARAMAGVYGSEPSRGLLNHFFLNEYSRKSAAQTASIGTPEFVKRVGIIGAGLMGKSIAREALKAQCEVTITDNAPEIVETFVREMNDLNLVGAHDFSELAECDLILECVTEQLGLKQQIWAALSQLAGPSQLFATNTSALGVAEIFQSVSNRSRCCGIHYCHPELMELVEIIRTPETSDDTIASAVAWVMNQRKTPVVVHDAPGFVVNRILTAMIDSAVALFENGNHVADIDDAFRDFGFRGGPFEIMDIIGIDTVVHAGRGMFAQGIRQVTASPILPMLMKKKRWGRKTGGGFYDYTTPEGPALISSEAQRLLQPYQRDSIQSSPPRSIVPDVLANMLIAATEILSSHVVSNPRDIDLAMIKGLGFPAHHGGLLFWAGRANRLGLQSSLDWNLSRLASLEPSPVLVEWLRNERPFYTTV